MGKRKRALITYGPGVVMVALLVTGLVLVRGGGPPPVRIAVFESADSYRVCVSSHQPARYFTLRGCVRLAPGARIARGLEGGDLVIVDLQGGEGVAGVRSATKEDLRCVEAQRGTGVCRSGDR